MNRQMRAFVVSKPGQYGLTRVDIPRIRDDELLVKVGAAAICHSDIDIITGKRKHLVRYPNIIGHEFAGTVVEVGASAARFGFRGGETIVPECTLACGVCRQCANGHPEQCDNYLELGTMCPGGFAEYVAVPHWAAHRFTHLDMVSAAVTECAANAHKAARHTDLCPGDDVLVIGPGPIGLFSMLFVKRIAPCRVIMAGTRDDRLGMAKALGADETVNVRQCDAARRVMELTGGKGADAIIQCATSVSAFEMMLQVAGKRCRIVIEGFPNGGDAEADQRVAVDFSQFLIGPMSIAGMTGGARVDFEGVLRSFELGAVNPRDVITDVLPLEQIETGFERLRNKAANTVKVVVKMPD